MRFMMMFKSSRHSEAGLQPAPDLVRSLQKCCGEMAKAGVLLAADSLHPSSSGMRLTYPEGGGTPTVTVGPFDDPKSSIAGFLLIEVETREEAYDWAMRIPDPNGYGEGEIELREVRDAALWPDGPGMNYTLL